jgi:Rrf2 family iron-sulfur cluster assembly transcriptional regulator
MRLTTKGRYAVTAMLDLAIHYKEGPITLADISKRQGISLSYLEQLFSRLRKNGLVDSARGPGGGYRLSRAATEICVADVRTTVRASPMSCGAISATKFTVSLRASIWACWLIARACGMLPPVRIAR